MDADTVISDLSGRQHGIVSRTQLLEAGVSRHSVENRVKRRLLRPLYTGIYQVGPTRARLAREMAALLACGPEAVLCSRTAGILWELLRGRRQPSVVHVCVDRDRRVLRRGIRTYRIGCPPADEMTRHRGLRVSTPARTLLDMARTVRDRTLEQAVAAADRQGLADEADVRRLLERHRGRRGVRRLRGLLDRRGGAAFTRSEAEARLLDLIRRAKLPPPETNVMIDGVEVDFFWPKERFVAEMDGFGHHASRASFEWDRERDAGLTALGVKVHRVTWRQLASEPEAVLVRLAQALVTSRGRGVAAKRSASKSVDRL